jgi:hypothetical protein
MADMAISLAKNPRRQVRDLRWDALFTGSRETGERADAGTAGSASAGFAAEGPQGSGAGGRSEDAGPVGSGGTADAGTSSADEGPIGSGSGGRSEVTDFASGGQIGSSGGREGGGAADAGAGSVDEGGLGSGTGGRIASAAAADDGPHGSGTSGEMDVGGHVGGRQTAVDFGTADTGLFEPPHLVDESAGAQPIRAEAPGSYVDASPSADLEPPVDARTEPGPTESGAEGHGRDAGTQG